MQLLYHIFSVISRKIKKLESHAKNDRIVRDKMTLKAGKRKHMDKSEKEIKLIIKKAVTILVGFAMFVSAASNLSACSFDEVVVGSKADWSGYKKESFHLNTLCDITIYRVDMNKAFGGRVDSEPSAFSEEKLNNKYNEIITECFKLISDYEKILSKTIEGSDIDKINKSAGMPIQVEKETIEVIKKGIEFGELSGGMFDITIGKASKLWDFHSFDDAVSEDSENAVPPEDELKEAVSHIDYKKIVIDESTGYIKIKDPEIEIDLGGIAKGYIADKAADFLREKGVVSGVVNLGGNIVAIGGKALSAEYEKESSETTIDFNLGIVYPLSETRELLGTMPARDVTIVTSGTYERYIEIDGERYHHVLDPKTGMPVQSGLVQVSVIADAGYSADCDGLSTACLALGVDEGTKLINRLNSSKKYGSIEAIFLDSSGNVSFTNPDTEFVMSRRN